MNLPHWVRYGRETPVSETLAQNRVGVSPANPSYLQLQGVRNLLRLFTEKCRLCSPESHQPESGKWRKDNMRKLRTKGSKEGKDVLSAALGHFKENRPLL